MEDNENVVTEVTENVEEQATEKLVDGSEVTTETKKVEEKLYSQSELDALVNKRLDELLPQKIERAKSKLEKKYQEKYSRTENVLKAGLGADTIEEATDKLADFYKEKGIDIPESTGYSEQDINILANAEANEIINSGYDELVEEVDRLAQKGVEKMTSRERIVFQKLAEERKKQDSIKELAKIGVSKDALNDSEYQEFSKKLNPSMSEKDKYEMYIKYKPKQKVEPVGSMKDTTKNSGVKEFYSFEEASKFTKSDFDKNPELFKAVCNSMSKWGN